MKIMYIQYTDESPMALSTVITDDNIPAPVVSLPVKQIIVDHETDIVNKMIDINTGTLIEIPE